MKTLMLIVAGVMTLGLVGCGDGGSTAGVMPATLRFAAATSITNLDPQNTKTLNDFRILDMLYQPLIAIRPDTMAIEPGMAESWTTSDDGLTWTFKLRDGAMWSDGEPVTAEDFVFAYRRMLLPDTGGPYASLFFDIAGARDFYNGRLAQLAELAKDPSDAQEKLDATYQRFDATVGVNALDDKTLEIKLSHPVPYLQELVAFMPFSPLPEHVLAERMTLDETSGRVSIDTSYFGDPNQLVVNGPYVLQLWNLRDRTELVANPRYWAYDQRGNDKVIQYEIADPQVALRKYEQGELDWLPDIPTADRLAADLVAEDRPDVHHGPAVGTYYYAFNVAPQIDGKPNPLADPRVRKALSMAIDRQAIVEKITRMNQPVARTLVPVNTMPGYDAPTDAGITYNLEEAKRLLAEAGYPNGEGLEGLSIQINNGGGHELPAQFIKRQWEEQLGVRVGLEAYEWGMHLQRLEQGDYHIARAGWFADFRDPMTFLELFETGNSANTTRYSNPDYDRLLNEARQQSDAQQRMALLREAETILLNDQPLAPIYQYTNLNLYRPDQVRNLHPNPANVRRLEWVEVETAP